MEIFVFGKQYFISKALLLASILILVLGSGLLGYFLKQVYQPLREPAVENVSVSTSDPADGGSKEKTVEEKAVESIKVYIVGCVNKPGVVTLESGDVIEDAIGLAGGATKDADLENINLAFQLKENTMLRIKPKTAANKFAASQQGKSPTAPSSSTLKIPDSRQQSSEKGKQAGTPAGSDAANQSRGMNSGVDIISDSLGAVVSDEQELTGGGKNNLVNINTATQAELEELPNVGPATAKAIVDYREKNGEFKKLTDLMKITGIKQKTFDKIKDHICV